MPLGFASKSHGVVAFGYFNIETDLLLLEQQFFFADRFCRGVVELAEAGTGEQGEQEAWVAGWCIDKRARIGNLQGAIAGVDLTGFIGATYRLYPFPDRTEDFKQSPAGDQAQAQMTKLITAFAAERPIRLAWNTAADTVSVGEVVFEQRAFRDLVAYVERGGYPRYRDERRPSYVQQMMERLTELRSPWLPPPTTQRSS